MAAIAALPAAAVDDYATAQFTPLHIAECVPFGRLVPQYTPIPNDKVYMHVRHMGLLNTLELDRQVANFVTWDPSALTGYSPSSVIYQRGYKNNASLGTNVFQMECRSAGFLINTYQFGHNGIVECPSGFGGCSGGPNVAYSRKFSTPVQVWRNTSDELTLQGYFKIPYIHHDNNGTQGVAQLSMFYTLKDRTSGKLIFGLMGIYESRPFASSCANPGVGCEFIGNDGVAAAFASSPIRTSTPAGALRYMTQSPYSQSMAAPWGFANERFYRGHVKYANMQNIANDLQSGGLSVSSDPMDWELIEVGVLAEVFPGAQQHLENIVMGGSFRYFEAYRAHD